MSRLHGHRADGDAHRLAVLDRIYSGDASQRHLETLHLLDPAVRTCCLEHVARQHQSRTLLGCCCCDRRRGDAVSGQV